jgi:uncharacterized membrane protein (DUF2068 family)
MRHSNKGVHAVAVLEASKGLLSLLVAMGLHVYAGQNLSTLAIELVTHLHLNPANHYPSIFNFSSGFSVVIKPDVTGTRSCGIYFGALY